MKVRMNEEVNDDVLAAQEPAAVPEIAPSQVTGTNPKHVAMAAVLSYIAFSFLVPLIPMPRLHGLPFPTNFTAHYVSLVLAIRSAHPAARIVLLRGGMFGGAQSEPLRKAFEATVAQLEAADPGVSHYVFKHWTNQHPRVADDRMMAEELTAFLHSMKPFGCRTKLFLLLKLRFFFA